MIKFFHIRNFKNLADVQEEFGSLNAIIGPNGCGKSSLLQAIDFLRAFFYPSIEDYLKDKDSEYSDLPNLRQTGRRISWHLRACLGPDAQGEAQGEYDYEVSARRWRYLGVGVERLVYTPPGGQPKVLLDRSGRKLKVFGEVATKEDLALPSMPRSLMADIPGKARGKFREIIRFRDWVTSIRSFLIWDPKILRRPDRGKHYELGESGEHLAPVLANLRREAPDHFGRIVKRIRRLFPTVSDITIKGARGWGWQEINLVEADGTSVRFNSQQMSDGVLRLLAICALLYSKQVPAVLTLEEPENGIHPQLIAEVIQALRELTLRKPPHQCQVFFTTHSPYVVDQFLDHPEEVYVMERGRPKEGANIFRLSERKDIGLVKAEFSHSLGEAWFSGLLGGTAGGRIIGSH